MSQTRPSNEKFVVLTGALSVKGGSSVERGTVISSFEIGEEFIPRLLTLDRPAIRRATAEEAKLDRVSLDKADQKDASREETLTELRTQLAGYAEREQQQLTKIARYERALMAAGVDLAAIPDESVAPKAGLSNTDAAAQAEGRAQGGQNSQNRNGGQGGGR